MILFLLLCVMAAAPLHAQSAGRSGAQVLQINAGARAAGLSGAYSAAQGDADALFYNAAGIAGSQRGVSVAYETYSTDVAFGSLAGYTRIGSLVLGASIAYLNAGSVAEIEPSDEFGGNTGTPTGNSVSATESAGRLSLALPLRGGRIRAGASIGMIATAIAELNETAPLADVGLQFDVANVTLSTAIRNFGGRLGGRDALPAEARLGAAIPLALSRSIGVHVFGDAISRLNESTLAFAGGVEAGFMPRGSRDVGAVVRIGYDAESKQLAPLRFGAGINVRFVSLDYAFQTSDLVGAVHRLGVRWSVR